MKIKFLIAVFVFFLIACEKENDFPEEATDVGLCFCGHGVPG